MDSFFFYGRENHKVYYENQRGSNLYFERRAIMLTEKTTEIIEEVNKLKDIFMKQFTIEMLEDMDDEGIVAMRSCFKLMNLSMELAKEQAAAIDLIHIKLDKLLEAKEKGSI